MASINQIISEIAHSVGEPNNYALKENIKSAVIHTRNELIRHGFENHGYIDRNLNYRYTVSLIDINDGDIPDLPVNLNLIRKIKRTKQKVPRPVRLTNNLPFQRVSSVGYYNNIDFPFIKETSARFRKAVPGLCGIPSYDYINDYIYLFPTDNPGFNNNFEIKKIVIEAPFEHPTEVSILAGENESFEVDVYDDEWFIPEDMIGQIKDIITKRDLLQIPRENNEIENQTKL